MNTMTRCVAALFLALVFAGSALAQTVQRNFPATALRGEISFGQPPEVLVNGKPTRLAPAARIRGLNNLLVMSGALMGQRVVVNYSLDSLGLVQDVWILTDVERAKQPWPTTAKDAQTWSFDPIAQVWTKP
jgi:hypothetical protein